MMKGMVDARLSSYNTTTMNNSQGQNKPNNQQTTIQTSATKPDGKYATLRSPNTNDPRSWSINVQGARINSSGEKDSYHPDTSGVLASKDASQLQNQAEKTGMIGKTNEASFEPILGEAQQYPAGVGKASSHSQRGFIAAMRAKVKRASEGSHIKKSSYYTKIMNRDNSVNKHLLILMEKIRTLDGNIMFLLLIGYLIASVVFQAIMGYSKYITLDTVKIDLREKLIASDWNTVALTSMTDVLKVVEFSRAVIENKISDGYMADQGIPSILTSNNLIKKPLRLMLQQYTVATALKMINASYPNLVAEDMFFNDSKITEFRWEPILSLDGRTGEFTEFDSFSRNAIGYIQPYIDRFVLLDELTRDRTLLGADRKGDIIEELIRKNLNGELIGLVYRQSLRVSEYFTSVCDMSRRFLLYSQLSCILSICFVVFIVAVYTVLLKQKMKFVYFTMFDFRV